MTGEVLTVALQLSAHIAALDGLLSLCERCHKHKTLRHDHGRTDGQRGMFAGCDADGTPLDPFHPWNAE